jgi:hypothetical protein
MLRLQPLIPYSFAEGCDTSTSRYDAVDHIYVKRLSPAHLMESRNRQELEAFVRMLPYEGQDGAES